MAEQGKVQKLNKIYKGVHQKYLSKTHPEMRPRFPMRYILLALATLGFLTYLSSKGY